MPNASLEQHEQGFRLPAFSVKGPANIMSSWPTTSLHMHKDRTRWNKSHMFDLEDPERVERDWDQQEPHHLLMNQSIQKWREETAFRTPARTQEPWGRCLNLQFHLLRSNAQKTSWKCSPSHSLANLLLDGSHNGPTRSIVDLSWHRNVSYGEEERNWSFQPWEPSRKTGNAGWVLGWWFTCSCTAQWDRHKTHHSCNRNHPWWMCELDSAKSR